MERSQVWFRSNNRNIVEHPWEGLFDGVVQYTSNADLAYATTLNNTCPISGDIKVYASQGGSVNDIGNNKIILSDGSEVIIDNIGSNQRYFDFRLKQILLQLH